MKPEHIMFYLPAELKKKVQQYCLDNNIKTITEFMIKLIKEKIN